MEARHWNDDPQPLNWTRTVDDIITKVKQGQATLDRVTEYATDRWPTTVVVAGRRLLGWLNGCGAPSTPPD